VDGRLQGSRRLRPRGGVVEPEVVVWTGDSKDHVGYGPVVGVVEPEVVVWTGDSKDHVGYGPVVGVVEVVR
jgi:hypothetical protein